MGVHPPGDAREHPGGEPGEREVLPRKAEVHAPRRPEHPLAGPGGEHALERREDDHHERAEGRREQRGAHQRPPPAGGSGSAQSPAGALLPGKKWGLGAGATAKAVPAGSGAGAGRTMWGSAFDPGK